MQERWASFAKRHNKPLYPGPGIWASLPWEAECSLHVPHGWGCPGGPHRLAREVHACRLPRVLDSYVFQSSIGWEIGKVRRFFEMHGLFTGRSKEAST